MTSDERRQRAGQSRSSPTSSSSRALPASGLPSWASRSPWWVRPLRILLLALTDIVVVAGLGLLTVWLWAIQVRNQPFSLYLDVLPLVILIPLSFAISGLYPGFGLGAVETLRRLWVRVSFVFVVIAAVTFVLRIPHHYSRLVFLVTWLGSLVLLPLARFGFLSLAQRTRWWGERAVIVGRSRLAKSTIRSLEDAISFGYRPQWVMLPFESDPPEYVEGLPVVGGLEQAGELADMGVRVALAAVESPEEAASVVHDLQQYFRHVLSIRGDPEMPVEGVTVRNLGNVLAFEYNNNLLRRRNRILKRTMDIGLGGIGLVLSLPFLGLAIAGTKLASPGPAFFAQEREGEGGESILVRKLRTMYVDAEERLTHYLEEDDEARREWQSRFKLTDDPRIVPVVGRLLRRLSIDELPQLWSVVKGDMSLVGPRPFPEYHLQSFSDRFRSLRRRVRPGVTGLWQVMVRSEGDVRQQEFYDTYYIRNWSLWMDLYILGKTTVTILTGRGAY